MSKTPSATSTPIGMDVHRIEEAMRLLAVIAINSDREVRDRTGAYPPPGHPDTPIGRLICQPEGEAARMAYEHLAAHLAALIGQAAAIEVRQRINAVVLGNTEAGSHAPSMARH